MCTIAQLKYANSVYTDSPNLARRGFSMILPSWGLVYTLNIDNEPKKNAFLALVRFEIFACFIMGWQIMRRRNSVRKIKLPFDYSDNKNNLKYVRKAQFIIKYKI